MNLKNINKFSVFLFNSDVMNFNFIFFKFFTLIALSLFITACSVVGDVSQYLKSESVDPTALAISGTIELADSETEDSESNKTKFFKQKVQNLKSSSCESPKAYLYKLDQNGKIIEPAIASTDVKNQEYQFSDIYKNDLVDSSGQLTTALVIEVVGCSEPFVRIVTGLEKQVINRGISLVSQTIFNSDSNKIADVTKSEVEEFLQEARQFNNSQTLFEKLRTDPDMARKYKNIFGLSPEKLKNVPPRFVKFQILESIPEGAESYFSAQASHWDPENEIEYEWWVNGIKVSDVDHWKFSPGKNAQGNYQISIRSKLKSESEVVGSKSFQVTVENAFLPIAPSLSTGGWSWTNSSSIDLRLATGTNKENCQSFSKLAMTFDPFTAPLNPSDYNIFCDDESSQEVSLTLSGGDGPKTAALWAMDSSGKVSLVPSTLTFNLDQTSPTINLNTSGVYRGGDSVNLSYNIDDVQGSGITSGSLKYSVDAGATFNTVSGFNPNLNSYSWTVPIVDVNDAKLRIQVQDLAGNIATYTTTNFSIDSQAPSLTLSAPNSLYKTQSQISVSGTCESLIPVLVLGDGITNQSISCSSGAFASNISISGSDGTKNLTFSQQDQAGNVTTVSRAFIKDSQGPVLTFLGPSANTKARTSLAITGSCESGLSVSVAGSGISNPGSASCNSGSFSYTVDLSGSDGIKNVSVSQTDEAGNTGSVSRDFEKYNQAPILTLTTPVDSSPVRSPVTITGSCESGISVVVAGAGTTSAGSYNCTSGSFSISLNLTTGESSKAITISQTDIIGNVASISVNYDRDDSAPALSVVGPVDGARYQNSLVVSGNCEAGRNVTISGAGISAPVVSSCSAASFSQNVSLSTGEGNKVLDVTQSDLAGNSVTVSRTVVRDNTAPMVTVGSHSENQVVNAGVTLTGTCEDLSSAGSSTVTVSSAALASDVTANCNSGAYSANLNLTGTDATKSIVVTQVDQAGNSGSVTRLLNLDTTSPNLTKTSPADGSSFQGAVTLVGACESGYQVHVSGSGITSSQSQLCVGAGYSIPVTLTGGDGAKAITVTQADSVSNSTVINFSLIKDTVAPTLAISGPASMTSGQSGVTITGTCESGVLINLSGSGLQTPSSGSCSSGVFSIPISFSSTDGNKVIELSQTDSAGNTSTASRTFVRDNAAPTLTLSSPAANTRAQSSVTLSGTCENGVNVNYAGAGILSAFSGTCSAGVFSQQVFFKSDSDGTKTIIISQTDAAGNSTSVSRDFVRDNLAPVITQTTLSYPYYSNGNSVTFGGSCESGIAVVIKKSGVDQGTATCPSGAWTYSVASESADATYDYTFHQTDFAGNTSSTAGRWFRDTSPPVISITSGANQLTASNSVTMSGACETGIGQVVVTGSASSSVSCNSGAWSYTTPTVTTDAIRSYTFTLTDQSGNSASVTAQWERNTNVPNLTITTASPIKNADNSATVTGVCQTGFNVEIRLSGSLENSVPCASGSYTYSFANQSSDGSRTYEFKQTNSVNLSTTTSISWVRDTSAPVLTSSQFMINSNDSTTTRARVSVALQAIDSLTNITHICLKTNDSSAPIGGASCWVAIDSAGIGLTPSTSLNLSNYGYNLPITPATYSVYAWVKDEVGNISSLTNAGNGTAQKDLESIQLVSTIPPTLSYVLAGSTDYPAQPPSNVDLTVGTGAPVYLKWKASDDQVLPSNAVSIYFTTDEVNWSLVTNNLVNGSNGSCVVNHGSTPADDDATGCYRMNASPASGFVKFRVVIKDSDGLETGASSVALNLTSIMKFLAGNTDPGINLSAQSAMFFYRRMSSDMITSDINTLAVTRDGVVYFKDSVRGILKVDPSDGVARVFLRTTGTSSGDGGPVSAATARRINKIVLDHAQPKQRLWIFDFDRIRRVNLETGVITTVIGGGTDDSDTVANPLNARVDAFAGDYEWWDGWSLFFAAPNGDFYFRAHNDGTYDWDTRPVANKLRVRRLSASTGQITSWRVTSITSARDLANGNYNSCSLRNIAFQYDKATSNITERFGVLRTWSGFTGCVANPDGGLLVGFDSSGVSDSSLHPYSARGAGVTAWWNERLRMFNGLDGKVYAVTKDHLLNGIFRYDGHPTYGWTRILGGGPSDFNQGFCPDGTDATACRSRAADAFVSENGTVYFVDDGLIRTINSSGKVVTLMGQRQISGHGGPVQSIRLGNSIRSFRLRSDGGILFGSQAHQQIHEIDPNGTIYHIAGNGVIGGVSDAVNAKDVFMNIENPNGTGDDFAMDPATGDIYHHGGTWAIRKLTRSSTAIGASGTWSQWLGGGANHWSNPGADGSSSIRWDGDCSYGVDMGVYTWASCWFFPKLIGYGGGQLISHQSIYARRTIDNADIPLHNMMKLYDVNTKVQTHLLGKNGLNSVTNNFWEGIGSVGTALNSLDFWAADGSRLASPVHVSGNRWLFMRYWNGGWKDIYDVTPGGNLLSMTQLASGAKSFTYRQHNGKDLIYYCGVNGLLYRRDVQAVIEVNLPWPVSGMTCESSALFYRSSSQSIILAYRLNGLMGFAEYFDPM